MKKIDIDLVEWFGTGGLVLLGLLFLPIIFLGGLTIFLCEYFANDEK